MWTKIFSKREPIEQTPAEQHNHTWALVAHTYARPRKDIPAELLSKESAEKLLFGVTTLAWECTSCGATRQEFLLGSDQNTLDEVLDKVDEFNSHILTRGETRYLITKFVSPNNGIPLR